MSARDFSRAWLAAAILVSAALVLGSPVVGQLRSDLRTATGSGFPRVMALGVGALAAAATLYALLRIRDRRWMRYGAIAAALGIAIGYAAATETGNPDVDAVERFHFIEYGLITALFYRACRPAADRSLLILPVLAAFVVGVLEEWLQWFVPARVGEVRDVLLNAFAIGCGLLFSLGLDPPAIWSRRLSPRSRRRLAWLLVTALLVFSGFFHAVHLGYEITDPEAGVFRSRYAPDQLAAIAADRARTWPAAPPRTWSRYSREDQYLSEGVAHVRRRNEAWAAGNLPAARHENMILEEYYAPVLDTASYVSTQGFRWPAAQKADAESRGGPGFMIYVSNAEESPILVWPKWAFWLGTAALAALTLRAFRPAA